MLSFAIAARSRQNVIEADSHPGKQDFTALSNFTKR